VLGRATDAALAEAESYPMRVGSKTSTSVTFANSLAWRWGWTWAGSSRLYRPAIRQPKSVSYAMTILQHRCRICP